MTRNVDQLRSIQTFEELIPFLEDDLDWPFPHGSQEYEFDDLTFEYTPDELGLEDEYAAKIKRIHQLRPLVSGQPWGIFFVEFENKKLPIVVLRRILSHLVLKQRKSSNPADRARWNAGDLLFISAFAEEETLQREIAFAHFHQDPGDQPTLRVLGWDGGDTPLKLEHVSQILRHRLSWPRDAADHAAWRKQWAGAFRYSIGQQIQTADMLARELARVARNIRDAAMALMKVESSRGPLRRMHEAFRTALIHDLTPEGFADTYAQTITYGLLTAAISRTDRSAGADGTFVLAEDIHNMVPITNPFLKEMLESFLKVGGRGTSKQPGLDFDELGVQEVVELLRSSDIDLPAVLEDFGNRNPGEDPVIRFYEDFLKAYNKELKIKRGVFYTPQPAVSYIVRSVHELLQTEFGLPDGLASTITWGEMAAQMTAAGKTFRIPEGSSPDSHFVVILDPATGTATFLVEVIDVIFRTLTNKWKAERLTSAQQRHEWNRYVPAHLLPRLFGYELMMAPYAIAHMKMGLKLHETGYTFGSDQRVQIYLTNALEQAQDFSDRLAFDIPALAHEAQAVNAVKRHVHFSVIVGNPPYSASESEPEWLMSGLQKWKTGLNETKSDLNREEWKFLFVAEFTAKSLSVAVVGVIVNRDFLDGIVKRTMRSSLQDTFAHRLIVDLNGDVKGNIADDNVFDIAQGVCIAILCRGGSARNSFTSLVGTRDHKYKMLSNKPELDLAFEESLPLSPYFRWGPKQNSSAVNLEQEYMDWLPLNQIFTTYSSGIQTKRDALCIDTAEESLWERVVELAAVSEDVARSVFDLGDDGRDWTVAGAKADLIRSGPSREYLTPILYRPFDQRFTYWTGRTKGFLAYPRREVMQHVISKENIGLIFNRQVVGDRTSHFGVSRLPICHGTFYLGNKGQDYFAPLYVYGDQSLMLSSETKQPNLSREAIRRWNCANGASEQEATPETVMNFIYAVVHSPSYRERYSYLLRRDFACIPFGKNLHMRRLLAQLGARLVQVHLLEAHELNSQSIFYEGPHMPIATVFHEIDTVWIDSNRRAGIRGVSKEVWNFEMGGYLVCHKWLKDRKGGALSSDDITHYGKIVTAILETIRIMLEIDKVIEDHGGWPGAFA